MAPKVTLKTTSRTSKPAEQLRQFLTVKEVAALDQVSVKTVRRAIAAGQLKVVRVGPKGHLIRIDPLMFAAYRQPRGDVT